MSQHSQSQQPDHSSSPKRPRFRDLSPQEQQEFRDAMRHSAAHVLAEATLKLFPEAKLTIGPPIKDGFYYDFDVSRPFTPEDLEAVEKEMQDSIRANTDFVEREVSRDEAKTLVSDNPYKLEILENIPEDERVTFCSHSDGTFEDLCRGGHVHRTGDIKAFKLLSAAGAYWRGSENNPMLQRIYGTAWESRQAMREYLKRRELAQQRDHRRLGNRMSLFFFDPVAPANPFFLPNGTILYNQLHEYVRQLYRRYGYQEVVTPQLFKTELFKTSGHYDNYIENMYTLHIDEQEYGIKPMNCPSHAVIFSKSLHSYRDLPIRYADFGRLHRYELSGVTQGLTRVRSFSQDDAHIFCSEDQIAQEVNGFIDMLEESYKVFGFQDARYTLSLRPERRAGSDNQWDRAEAALEAVLQERETPYEEAPGEGAFYGPKVDIFVPDALQREWQLGTVQVDFSQPERFDLHYINPQGDRERPVMIHRAMLGSLERFIGVLIEHLGGDLPLWLAPVQAVMIPIADRHNQYCQDIAQQMRAAGLRVDVNAASERMNAKIRDAQLAKINYMLVAGDREQQAQSASLRTRDGKDLGPMPVSDIIAKLTQETDTRALTSHA